MLKYILKRVMSGLITIFILISITFVLMRAMPGSPFNSERGISDQVRLILETKYHMNESLPKQYFIYLSNIFKGDLGESFKHPDTTVVEIISRGAPTSMKLGIVAFLITVVLGISLGIASALSKSKAINLIVVLLSTIGVSIPSFVLALIMMTLFGVQLRWLPTMGLDTPLHYILPCTALALYPVAYISRLVKSNLVEVMKQDYIRMAKAKGLSKSSIVLNHALKNAMTPVITYLGPLIAFLLTGSFVIENLFSIPGIGTEFVRSITNRDYSTILGLTIFLGSLVITANIIVDIICAMVDPRIKLD